MKQNLETRMFEDCPFPPHVPSDLLIADWGKETQMDNTFVVVEGI